VRFDRHRQLAGPLELGRHRVAGDRGLELVQVLVAEPGQRLVLVGPAAASVLLAVG